MSLIAKIFRFIFISFIAGGLLLVIYPAVCHLIRSGLIYDPIIAGLIILSVGFVGFLFVEIFMDNDVELMWNVPLPPAPLPRDFENV